MEPAVSQEWLREHLGDDDVGVVDCRFVLGDPDGGRERYHDEHIAGAVFLDLDTDLAGPVGDGRRGRHPLPDPAAFAAAVQGAGIDSGTTVVAYDDGRTGGAARLWWLLRHFGHERVAVLDGGWRAWDGPTESGDREVAPGDWGVRKVRQDTVEAEDLQRGGMTVVDARAPERFRGEVEPIDPVPGRIPGARNASYTAPVPEDLLTGAEELVVYCGSGVTACVVLHDLATRGRDDAKLYPGSYSEWSTRGLPTQRG